MDRCTSSDTIDLLTEVIGKAWELATLDFSGRKRQEHLPRLNLDAILHLTTTCLMNLQGFAPPIVPSPLEDRKACDF
jgi:hypothetical protein